MIPQTIGRYQIKGELGAGGMGIVYRAYDPDLLREVALKVLFQGQFRRLSDTEQQEILARFLQEGQIIASLHHVAIMPIYDFGRENGEPFIVMPLMSGGDLNERLKTGALPLNEIVRILDWLAPALDKVHQRSIIHRDLKPSNILFNEDNKPNIADFGIARLTEQTMSLSRSDTPIGTPAYMSPEQARGDKDIDQRSDIYSLGCMLFKMLTGERPYHQVHPFALLHFHMNEPVPRLDELRTDLPADYQVIIDRAMAKKKEKRYGSAGEMSAALKAVVVARRRPRQSNPSPQQAPSAPSNTQRATTYFEPRQRNRSPQQSPSAPSNTQSTTIYFNQGLTAYNKGNYDEAIANYNQAIRLNPNYAEAYNNRGLAYHNKGDYDQAIADYDQAISLNPTYTAAYLSRGMAYQSQGYREWAIFDYKKVQKLNNDPQATKLAKENLLRFKPTIAQKQQNLVITKTIIKFFVVLVSLLFISYFLLILLFSVLP